MASVEPSSNVSNDAFGTILITGASSDTNGCISPTIACCSRNDCIGYEMYSWPL